MSDIDHIENTPVDNEPEKKVRRRKMEATESVVEEPTVNTTIIVGRKETWSKLARRYGTSEEALIEKNGDGPLYAGKIIQI